MNIPKGWKLVPVEPTQDMLDAFLQHQPYEKRADKDIREYFMLIYKLALAAAPTPPEHQGLAMVRKFCNHELKKPITDQQDSAVQETLKHILMLLEPATPPAQSVQQPKLSVWFGSMPESNGKQNWTVFLHRAEEEEFYTGICIDRTEYKDRARYEADRLRYMIGELTEKPDILDYDGNLKPPAQDDEPRCPRPCNGRPDDLTMAECILSGECGCTAKGTEYGKRKAQDDEPVAEVKLIAGLPKIVAIVGYSTLIPGSLLYTRPDTSELRKAAEELYNAVDMRVGRDTRNFLDEEMENLRAALDKGES